jgi:hypothetical protein
MGRLPWRKDGSVFFTRTGVFFIWLSWVLFARLSTGVFFTWSSLESSLLDPLWSLSQSESLATDSSSDRPSWPWAPPSLLPFVGCLYVQALSCPVIYPVSRLVSSKPHLNNPYNLGSHLQENTHVPYKDQSVNVQGNSTLNVGLFWTLYQVVLMMATSLNDN